MRLMAAGAEGASGVLGGDHLGKASGLGGVLFVAAPAEVGHVGEDGLMRGGVVRIRVSGLRSVAGFASDVRVFAGSAHPGLVVVAHHASILTGVGDGMLADDGEGRGVIVAVLAEGLGNEGRTDEKEGCESH